MVSVSGQKSPAKFLVSGSRDKSIRMWDVRTRRLLSTLSGHQNYVNALEVVGELLASGSADGTIKLWQLQIGKSECVRTIESHSGWVLSLLYVPHAQQLVSASTDQTIKVWDINQEEEETLVTKADFGVYSYFTRSPWFYGSQLVAIMLF